MSENPGGAPAPHSLGQAIEKLRPRWRRFVGFGVLCCLFGLLALGMVVASTLALVFFLAVMLVVAGGSEMILGFNSRDWPTFLLWVVSGLFYVICGAYALARPEIAAAVFTVFAGFGFLVAGAARIWLGLKLPGDHRAFVVLAGVVTLLLGAMILVGWPGDSWIILGTLFGVDLVFYGASWIALGLKLRA